jgi:hypothetical protein
MYKIKGFIIGATLLALVLILGSFDLACDAKSAQPPSSPSATEPTTDQLTSPQPTLTAPQVPVNYTTYMDESGLFSISYPADWETKPPQTTLYGKNAKETVSGLKSGLPVEDFSVIFVAEKPPQDSNEPYVNISLEPLPAGVTTLEQVIQSDMLAARTAYKDFTQLSGIKTTVDGKEAAIIEWEGTIPAEQYNLYCFQLYMLTDKAIWVVTCGSSHENSTPWRDDFNTIVRTIRISN